MLYQRSKTEYGKQGSQQYTKPPRFLLSARKQSFMMTVGRRTLLQLLLIQEHVVKRLGVHLERHSFAFGSSQRF
eukprot:1383389-Rhodomonas_salina.2